MRVVHLVLAEEAVLALRPGLTVITGDTGAGKSLLVDAIGALVGRRVERDQIRAGESSARCEGVFIETGEPSGESHLEELLKESGLALEEATLLLTREFARDGPSVARVNGRTVPVSTLRRLGEVLVDIQGQQEHLSILRPLEQLRLLDRFGGLDAVRAQCEALHGELRRLREEM
ncbi:MAG: AAA family ATPase, partial [Chloroflexi bacterium]|nr:AAA family ATPase [Chloroflexota bacterium]